MAISCIQVDINNNILELSSTQFLSCQIKHSALEPNNLADWVRLHLGTAGNVDDDDYSHSTAAFLTGISAGH